MRQSSFAVVPRADKPVIAFGRMNYTFGQEGVAIFKRRSAFRSYKGYSRRSRALGALAFYGARAGRTIVPSRRREARAVRSTVPRSKPRSASAACRRRKASWRKRLAESGRTPPKSAFPLRSRSCRRK